jgi:hypothetical protein
MDFVEQQSQSRDAATPSVSPDQDSDRLVPDQPANFRFRKRPLQPVG